MLVTVPSMRTVWVVSKAASPWCAHRAAAQSSTTASSSAVRVATVRLAGTGLPDASNSIALTSLDREYLCRDDKCPMAEREYMGCRGTQSSPAIPYCETPAD